MAISFWGWDQRGPNFANSSSCRRYVQAEFDPDWVGCLHSGDGDNIREESLNLELGGE